MSDADQDVNGNGRKRRPPNRGRRERSPADEFERLALPHLGDAYRFARYLTRDDHAAEDLVQEAYLKAFKAYGSFELRESGIKPWLLKILHNAYLDRLPRERRMPRSADQGQLERGMRADGSDLGCAAPPALDYERLDEEVKQAIEGLAPSRRAVLLLWATMEYSYGEIAEVLSVPIGTVMSRLHRARQQVVCRLGEFARQNGLLGGKNRPARSQPASPEDPV